MLVGPAGTGKSTAIEQISRYLNLPFYTANRVQNAFELTGYNDASGKYIPTQFYEAYKNGGLFLFDEIDASAPEALVTINTAIAQGFMAFPGHTKHVLMHKNFKMVCAGNTFGTGKEEVCISYFNLKHENEFLDLRNVFFPMTHVSFLRRLNFRLLEVTPEIPPSWNKNYGIACSSGMIQKFLEPPPKSIVMSLPDELNIEGEDIIEDAKNCFKALHIDELFKPIQK